MQNSPDARAQAAGWRASLNGWWEADTATLGGLRLPGEALPGLALWLFDQTICLGRDVGTLELHHDRGGTAIDILVTRGPNRWRFIPGLLQQRPPRLRLCLDLSGRQRPLTFDSLPGSRVLLVEYLRAPQPGVSPLMSVPAGACQSQ